MAVNLSAACQRAAHAMPGGRRKKKMGAEPQRLRGRRIFFYCFPASKKIYIHLPPPPPFDSSFFLIPHIPPGQQQIIDSEFPGQPRSVGPPSPYGQLETARISWSLWPIGGGDLLSIGFRAVRPLYFLIHYYIFAMNTKKASLIEHEQKTPKHFQ